MQVELLPPAADGVGGGDGGVSSPMMAFPTAPTVHFDAPPPPPPTDANDDGDIGVPGGDGGHAMGVVTPPPLPPPQEVEADDDLPQRVIVNPPDDESQGAVDQPPPPPQDVADDAHQHVMPSGYGDVTDAPPEEDASSTAHTAAMADASPVPTAPVAAEDRAAADVTTECGADRASSLSLIARRSATRELSPDRRLQLISKSRERLASVRAAEREAESVIRGLADEVDTLQRSVERSERLAEAAAHFARLSSAQQDEVSALDALAVGNAIESALAAAEEARGSLTIAQARSEDERAATATAGEQLANARAAADAAERAVEEWRARASDFDANRTALKRKSDEVNGLKIVADRLQRDVDFARESTGSWSAELDAATSSVNQLTQEAEAAADRVTRLETKLTAVCASATSERHDAERRLHSDRSRQAFEKRVMGERLEKAVAERDRTKLAALQQETELHALRAKFRAAERADDAAILRDSITTYEFELGRLKQDLALRPAADQVEAVRAALQQQVTTLSLEHARLMDDLDLVSNGAQGQQVLAARCDDLRVRLEQIETRVLPDVKRRVQELKSASFELRLAIEQWDDDEYPRHVAFEQRLHDEVEALRARQAERFAAKQAAIDAAQARRDAALEDVRSMRRQLLARGVDPNTVPEVDESIMVSAGVEASPPNARGGTGPSSVAGASPERTMEVEIVRADGDTTDADRNAVTRMAVRAPPRPALYHQPGRGGERHFNFFAVSVLTSVVGLFRRRRRAVQPPQPMVSV